MRAARTEIGHLNKSKKKKNQLLPRGHQMMATLEDLLHLQALHGMLRHLLPCLAQQAVPHVLLPMALQGVLTGLIIQVITCPTPPSN